MKTKKQRGNFLNGCLWSSPKLLLNVVNVLIVTYISFYATDVLGMSAGVIATVLLVTKLFDGVTDLLAGFLIDNTNSKWGKARPYDWAIPFVAIFLILLFSVPKANQTFQVIYIGVMYVLVQAVFITLLGASDSVYLLRAFRDEKRRNSVYTISLIFSQILSLGIGVLIPIWVAKAGTSSSGWTRMLLCISIPFAVIGMIRFFTIKEETVELVSGESSEKVKKEKVKASDAAKAILKNKYLLIFTLGIFIIVIASGFLNTSMAYYFKYFVGDQSKMAVANLGAFALLAMLVLFMPLANKIGKDRLLKICLVILCAGNIIRWIGGTNIITITIGLAMLYVGIVPITLYFPLYLFDIMDYSEWKLGTRVEGVLAVFPNFANKVAAGLAVSLGSFVLQAANYDGTLTVQTESAMNAINVCFNIIPTILTGIMAIVIIVFYNMDKILPIAKKEIAERKQNERE